VDADRRRRQSCRGYSQSNRRIFCRSYRILNCIDCCFDYS
jgi:predicted trehalose synthase